jgi:hypothetical protein
MVDVRFFFKFQFGADKNYETERGCGTGSGGETRRERKYTVDGYKHGDDAKFRGYVRLF